MEAYGEENVNAASMGPRSHERGKTQSEIWWTWQHARLQWGRVLMNAEKHGGTFLWGRPITTLQWGRVLMNAENLPLARPETARKGTSSLQWGRVLMNAENNLRNAAVSESRLASMGPRSHERGNAFARKPIIPGNFTLLQMGPRSHERGNRPLDNSLRNKGFFACYREVVVCTRSHWLVGRVVMA